MSQRHKRLKVNNFFISQPIFKCNMSIAFVFSHLSHNILKYLRMLFIFCQTTFLYLFMWQYYHKWDNWHVPIIAQNLLTVRYNYQIYHCILGLAAKNINNVDNYCNNIHDLSKFCLFQSTLI